jgi:6-phosphogluconolactonase (cycloisomerase 2 family)
MKVFLSSFISAAVLLSSVGSASTEKQPGDLEEVQRLTDDILMSVTSVAISPDGKFAYAAAFNSHTISTLRRDIESGKLEIIDATQGPDLQCVVSVRLSRDGEYAVASAFAADAISLYKRDAATGKLTLLDVARQGANGADGLDFVIDANFSPDNAYIYTGSSNGVGVYKVQDGKLTFLQLMNAERRLAGLRAATLSPDGKTLYAAGASSGTVGVLKRDAATGMLEVGQLLADGEEGIETLQGAFRVGCSADGKHVYVSSGRFGGDQAVTAFAVRPDGNLQLIEAHEAAGTLEQFQGGNDIKVSPDGRLVFALATLSDRMFRFQRDAEAGTLISIGSQPVGDNVQPGSAGLAFSPDGKFVYIADENSKTIVVLKVP